MMILEHFWHFFVIMKKCSMDGSMDRPTDGPMDGPKDVPMDGPADGPTDGIYRETDRQTII